MAILGLEYKRLGDVYTDLVCLRPRQVYSKTERVTIGARGEEKRPAKMTGSELKERLFGHEGPAWKKW